MGKQRYDQRVRAFVEVRGGPPDWELAGERFAAHGWPVRDSAAAGAGPLGDAVEARPDSRVYEIEVRLPGIAKGADLGAARRVAKALRAARVEGYVRRAEVLHRDRETPSYWRTVDTRSRPRPRPAGAGPGRLLYRARLALGLADGQTLVHAEGRQALRLARVGLGAEALVTGVRPLDRRWRKIAGRLPEELGDRRYGAVAVWALATALALPFVKGTGGWALMPGLVLLLAGVVGTLLSAARLSRGWEGVAAGAVLLGGLNFLMLGGFGGAAISRTQAAYYAATYLIVAGLWVLVRQWSWGEWMAWVVPLLVTLAVSTFVAAGSVLHARYALGFGLSPDDLDVPPIWQTVAAVKVLTLSSLVLVVPAWWGLARHRHHSYATPGDSFNVVLWLSCLIVMLGVVALRAFDTASDAVTRTTHAAERGTDPPPFFGVQPDWTCVEPVVPAAGISGEGPPLDPTRPYLSFGVAGGNAVLWDAKAGEPVKVPASKVRLVPADGADQACAA